MEFFVKHLSENQMAEAEVAFRLAFHLLSLPNSQNTASVALDGAQVKVGPNEIFQIVPFLRDIGWHQIDQKGHRDWQGRYKKDSKYLEIHSKSGIGDVVLTVGGKRIRAECKKGPLIPKRGNPEYRLLREAIGQVVTVEQVNEGDLLVVAVPNGPKFRQLVPVWRERPLIKRIGIQIALVDRDGTVEGLNI